MVRLTQEDGSFILLEDGSFLLMEPANIRTRNPTEVAVTSVTLRGTVDILNADSVTGFFRYRLENESSWLETTTQTITSVGDYLFEVIELPDPGVYETEFVITSDFNEESGGIGGFSTLEFDFDWIELGTQEAVIGLNTMTITGLDVSREYDVQAFFEYEGTRVYADILTFPVGNVNRMFDNGVKRFDLGYDNSLDEILFIEEF